MNTLIILLIVFSTPLALIAVAANVKGEMFVKIIYRTFGFGCLVFSIIILLKLTHVI